MPKIILAAVTLLVLVVGVAGALYHFALPGLSSARRTRPR
jgi:hypothetical protein